MASEQIFALIRHGEYEQPAGVPSALLPYPLTELGCQQAAAAAKTLQAFSSEHDVPIHQQIDCSKQLRAWQTANIISNGLSQGGEVHEYEALSERSVGAVANLTVAEIESIIEKDPRYEAPPAGWKSDSKYCLPFQGAESLWMAGERVAGHLRALAKNSPDLPCLKIVVGHGASIRHAMVHLGIMALEIVPTISMYHATPIYIAVTRKGEWRKIGGEWKQRSNHKSGDPMDAGQGDEFRES